MTDPTTQAAELEPLSDEEIDTLAREFAIDGAPSRFALVQVIDDGWDSGMLGCGLAFPDEAVVYFGGGDRPEFAHCTSAQRARHLFARPHEIRLVWIDPDPATKND